MKEELKDLIFRYRIKGKKKETDNEKGFKYLSDDFTNVSESEVIHQMKYRVERYLGFEGGWEFIDLHQDDIDEIKLIIYLANNCEGGSVNEGSGSIRI